MVSKLFLYKESRIFLVIVCIVFFSIPILGYVPPEDYDLHRHYEIYHLYQNTDNPNYLKSYFGLTYLMQLLVLIGLPAQSMVFVCSFLFLFSIFKLNAFISFYSCQSSEKRLLSSVMVIAILSLFVFEYIALMSGLRFAIAVSFFIIALLADYKNNNKTSMVCHLLAVSFHFSLLGLIVVFFISKIIHIKRVVNIFLFIFGIVFSYYIADFQKYILDVVSVLQLTGDWAHKADTYLFGEWGTKSAERLNSNGIFVMYLSRAVTYMCFFVFLLNNRAFKISHNNEFVSLCVVLLGFTSAFYAIGRFDSVVLCFIFLPIWVKLTLMKKLNYYEWSILFLILFRGLVQLFNYRKAYFDLLSW